MFFKGLVNSFKNTKQVTKSTTNKIWDMIKEIPKLPWKSLPLLGWYYIIFGTLAFIVIIFVLVPLLNR